ncbi:MAG TPA: polymer-forming cytoskeletal protein, partial [Flavihumibacter sp.]
MQKKDSTLKLFNGMLIAFLCSISPVVFGQSSLKDYILFSGKSGCSNCGIDFGGGLKITSGNTGSYNFIRSFGSTDINGDLHSQGFVHFVDYAVLNGNIRSANVTKYTTAVYIGKHSKITGNIDGDGNIQIGGPVIKGDITLPKKYTYTGP